MNEKSGQATTHFERRLLPHNPEQVFDVVADVDRYKEFLPYTKESRVVRRNGNQFEAEMSVGFMLLKERYVSSVVLDRPRSVKVSVIHSELFHFLTNSWEFAPGPNNSCWTSFSVAFRWRSQIHKAVTDMVFNEVNKTMLSAFASRCDQLYGRTRTPRPSPPPPTPPKQAASAYPANIRPSASKPVHGS